MNIMHSSRSDSWRTPSDIVVRVRLVLGGIDLDPASDTTANLIVKAKRIYTVEDDGLVKSWSGRVFCNPPGGKLRGRSKTALFWKKLMESQFVTSAIFLAFSLEALQTSQGVGVPSILRYPICVPKRRIKFVGAPGKESPSHSNVIVGVRVDPVKFAEAFSDLGDVKI